MNEIASCATRWSITNRSDKAVVELVERVMNLSQPRSPPIDRRKDPRTAFPHLITLTPIADKEMICTGEPVTVVGKFLAARGLDFFHSDVLPFKRSIVSFDESLELEDSHFVLNITWCRFLRPGWYDSGGRFTHIVSPNSNELLDLP